MTAFAFPDFLAIGAVFIGFPVAALLADSFVHPRPRKPVAPIRPNPRPVPLSLIREHVAAGVAGVPLAQIAQALANLDAEARQERIVSRAREERHDFPLFPRKRHARGN